ncbi:MAG: gliding motility protein GldC [Ignavibacteria bacterium]|nr:gliding motility protein GldC [Ignavibacteria bacterium]
MSKKSKIILNIELDKKVVPQSISWQADDAGFEGKKDADAMMLSLWDKDEKLTFGIDLWTNKMLVENMNILFHQTFLKMADTYNRATNNFETSEMIRKFANEFAEKLSLLQK